jgi:hypothetical protein
MTLNGIVLDNITNVGVPFAPIVVTDSKGNLIGNNAVNSDVDGKYTLKNVNATDYLKVKALGYNLSLIPVKNAVVKNDIGVLNIRLAEDKKFTTDEIKIIAEKTVKEKTVKEKEKEKAKEPMELWVKIALGVGAVTVLGIIIFLATKEDKKGKK